MKFAAVFAFIAVWLAVDINSVQSKGSRRRYKKQQVTKLPRENYPSLVTYCQDNYFIMVATSSCLEHKAPGYTDDNRVYQGELNGKQVVVSEDEVDFCPEFGFWYQRTFVTCCFGRKFGGGCKTDRGFYYNVWGTAGPAKDVKFFTYTLLTGWWYKEFRLRIQGHKSCYDDLKPHSNQESTSYVTKYKKCVLWANTKNRKDFEYSLMIKRGDNTKASEVKDCIEWSLKSFPEIKMLCTTGCTTDVRKPYVDNA